MGRVGVAVLSKCDLGGMKNCDCELRVQNRF